MPYIQKKYLVCNFSQKNVPGPVRLSNKNWTLSTWQLMEVTGPGRRRWVLGAVLKVLFLGVSSVPWPH
jgi:hypothetical protein